MISKKYFIVLVLVVCFFVVAFLYFQYKEPSVDGESTKNLPIGKGYSLDPPVLQRVDRGDGFFANQWDDSRKFGPVPALLQSKGNDYCRKSGGNYAKGFHPRAQGLNGKKIVGGAFLCGKHAMVSLEQLRRYSKKMSISKQVVCDSSMTVDAVANSIIRALDIASSDGGFEYSFFEIEEGGIAIITRPERVRENGQYLLGSNRWGLDGIPANFNIVDFIKDPFFRSNGYYRFFVFVISNDQLGIAASRDKSFFDIELRNGVSELNSAVADDSVDGYSVNVLVFSYTRPMDGDITFWDSQNVSVRQHLQASGIQAGLDIACR